MITAAVVVVVTAHVATLAEDDRVRVVVLRDEAADTCAKTADLLRAIRDRIGSEPFRRDRDARELRIGIAKDGDGLVARIVLFSSKGQRLGVRVIHGDADCESLTGDLVLAAAIAIDPLLLVRARAHVDETPATPSTSTPAEVATTRSNDGEVRDGDASLSDLPPPTQVVSTTTSLPPPAGIAVAGVVGIAGGVAPIVTPTIRVLSSFDYGVLDLEAGVRFDLPSRSPAGPALLDTALIAADFGACLNGRLDPNVSIAGCGDVEAGGLAAQAVNLANERPITAPWLAIGARGALEVPVLAEVDLLFTGGVGSPLLRARLVDDATGQLFFEPALFDWELGVGARIQIR